MIIDTTQTSIERKLQKRNNIQFEISWHPFPAPDIDYFEEEGGCSCHISPPCGYCTSRSECALCNNIVLNDYMIEFKGDWVCEECHLAARESNRVAVSGFCPVCKECALERMDDGDIRCYSCEAEMRFGVSVTSHKWPS